MNGTVNESEWEARINAAATALKITPEILENILKGLGIEKEPAGVELLDDEEIFKFGDFREAAKDMPIAALRLAMRHLRPKRSTVAETDGRTAQLRAMGFKTRLEDARTEMLLGLYDPSQPNDPVTLALKKRFGDKPAIAFADDGKVAVAETLRYLAGLEQGYPPQEAVRVGNKLAKLWPIGVKPDVLVEEDPLYPGSPLRDGCSVVNYRDWSQISLKARQLCRIIVERGEINRDNKEAVLRLLERAQRYDALVEVYPEAEMEFRRREAQDQLPKLKISLGSVVKPQNPFGIQRQY